MNYNDDCRLDFDTFASFCGKYKDSTNFTLKDDALLSSDNEISIIASNEAKFFQDQIKTLEFDKKRLEIDLEATHHRFKSEKASLQQKISELTSSESSLKSQVLSLQKELSKISQLSNDTNDKQAFFNSQIDFLTRENKRINDQYKIDKENWEFKVKNLEKPQKGQEEKDEIKTLVQLNKAESKISQLTSEIVELKVKNEMQKQNYQKRIDLIEGEVKKLRQDEQKYIKELEEKNKNNDKIISQLKKRIADIEKAVENTEPEKKTVAHKNSRQKSLEKKSGGSQSLSEKLSRSSKSPIIQSPKGKVIKNLLPLKRSNSNLKESSSIKEMSKRKTPVKDLNNDWPVKKPHRKDKEDKIINSNNQRVHNKTPSYLRKENQSCNIEGLEKEIAVLTGRYKYLLQMSQDATDVMSLKNEINKVAGEIEEKSNQMFNLKKKQQEFLRQQIRS
ncbi:hypothetical protein SteCoe_9704 [Stentor coeruleus]|uniref:Uncharacterized protein n=1 Tax=Stentor coeruleus TaxID=5963 RepID=A0A1R2CHF4_9CILI|nr:hypothetical protein SteCoe_9704 [Stentor coeruleus]